MSAEHRPDQEQVRTVAAVRLTAAPSRYEEWESLPAADRSAWLGERLRALVERAWREVPTLRRRLESGGLSPGTVQGIEDLSRLPAVEPSWLVAQQHDHPPFGGWLLVPAEHLRAVHILPGPLRLPEAREADPWRWGAALAAAGIERGAVVVVEAGARCPTAPMWMAGVAACGAVAIPVDPLDGRALRGLGPWATEATYLGTSRGLEIVLARITPGILRTAVVTGGEISTPLTMRADRLQLPLFRAFGTPELGCLAFECRPGGGAHVVADRVVEVLDPDTAQATAEGKTGRVVATRLDEVYPLLRLSTRARAAWQRDACLCGRTTPRLVKLQGA